MIMMVEDGISEYMKETNDFRIMVPLGWEFIDFGSSGLQVYHSDGGLLLAIKREGYNMTQEDEDVLMQSFTKRYNGSGPELIEFADHLWQKTTFDYFGTHQSLHTCIVDGAKISIQLSGHGHETHEELQMIFNSIKIR